MSQYTLADATIQDHWKRYKQMVYPEGIPAIQNCECHQAFFSGALIVLSAVVAARESLASPEVTDRLITRLHEEANALCSARAIELFAKNN